MKTKTSGEIEIEAAERASAAARNALGHIEGVIRKDLYLHTLGRVQLLVETLTQEMPGQQKARDDLTVATAQVIASILTHTANLSGSTPSRYFELSERLSTCIKNFQNSR